jgi:hypothetical protein
MVKLSHENQPFVQQPARRPVALVVPPKKDLIRGFAFDFNSPGDHYKIISSNVHQNKV